MPSRYAPWVGPLLVVFLAQTSATFLARIAPTLAPAMATRLGWRVEDIGLLSSAISLGSVMFLVAGTPLMLRLGSVRTLQFGLLAGSLGVLLHLLPWGAAAFMGSLLIGVALGPQGAAGNDVLRRHAPPAQQNLIFSLKQSGVPVGAVVAGLLLPVVAVWAGLLATFGLCVLLGLATLACIAPWRADLDAQRDRAQSVHWRTLLSRGNLRRPLRALAGNRNLRRVSVAGALLAGGQGVWFTFLVSYLVADLDFTLPQAGSLFAFMQVVSALARPALGWLSDRLRAPVRVLLWCTAASVATTLVLACTSARWPGWAIVLLITVAGLTVSSWNGVQGAQIARFSQPQAIADSSAGAMLLIFLANIVGPVLFGWTVTFSGSFAPGLVLAALATLCAAVPLRRMQRDAGER